MKALIIYRIDSSDDTNIGVIKKMMGQCDGLIHNCCQVDCIIHDKKQILLNAKPIYTRTNKISYPYFKWNFYNYLLGANLQEYDIYIFRYGLATTSFIKFLKRLKTRNPSAIVLIDMPTYPYAKEWKGAYGKAILMLDYYWKNKLQLYVNYILHSGKEKRIFNIPTLQLSNGIQLARLSIRKPVQRSSQKDEYRLLAMAKWQYWHGLDRLLKGIKKYSERGGDKTIHLDIVGVGPALKKIKTMITDDDLQSCITCHGTLKDEKLDLLFNQADIGVGTLGLHRKKVDIDSSLKSREYVARGLPFIMSSPDSDIGEGEDFVYKVDPDESGIDIEALIIYLDRLDSHKMIATMSSFAKTHLSWRTKMKHLLNQLNNSL